MQFNQIFDSHAHYSNTRFDADRDELLTALPGKGVAAVLEAAYTVGSSHMAQGFAKRYPFIWCSAGIHPHDAKDAPEDLEQQLEKLTAYEKCVAIGEAGLDYHYDHSPREVQRDIFCRQAAFAVENGLPLIVHDRDAHADTLEILKKYKPKGVVHCFSGSVETAREILRLGMYIGFTGAVTFGSAKRAPLVIEAVPLDRLLVETDCPYMAPVPLRGRRCESSMIVHIAQFIAGAKNMEAQEILSQTCQNACELFGIKL
ncbi:MAG: TatD family hydrolase [Oscillospiraceae bacterium]|nr:TatD family hydrolase [Oscillospiraceae bacterium]